MPYINFFILLTNYNTVFFNSLLLTIITTYYFLQFSIFFQKDLFLWIEEPKNARRARVEEIPVIRNKPPKLARLRLDGLLLVESTCIKLDCWSLNHSISIFLRVPSSLNFAIALDISWTNGEPFWKTWNNI